MFIKTRMNGTIVTVACHTSMQEDGRYGSTPLLVLATPEVMDMLDPPEGAEYVIIRKETEEADGSD